jgi:uncharacterized protein (TIGR02453 family)
MYCRPAFGKSRGAMHDVLESEGVCALLNTKRFPSSLEKLLDTNVNSDRKDNRAVPTDFAGFPNEMVTFFRGLTRNNRREWFQPRKHLFEEHVKKPMIALVGALNSDLVKFAPEYVSDPKKAIFRIYRDTRFSPDKTPYKTHIACSFARRGSERLCTGGFYFSVSHDEVEVAGGIYHPAPDTTLAVRTYISDNHEELRRLLAGKRLRKLLGELQGDELTRAPKGFDPCHPAIDVIKKKDWILDVSLDPALATTPRLYGEIVDRFRLMAPVIEFLNRPLLIEKPVKKLADFLT